jgi:hypothetical protein
VALRKNARATAERFFDSRKTSPVLDRIYEESVDAGAGTVRSFA